jgi:DNA polymerase V
MQAIHFSELNALEGHSSVSLPFFDFGVAAGDPVYVSHAVEQRIDLNRELVINPLSSFCVRVNGQSMIGAGIDDGDLLVVDRKLEPQDGKIILAWLDGEFTIKRFKKALNRIWLQAENPAFDPIEVTNYQEFRVWGVVTGVIKRL